MLESIEGTLDGWADEETGMSKELNDARLEALVQTGLVLKEAEIAGVASGKIGTGTEGTLGDSGDGALQFRSGSGPRRHPLSSSLPKQPLLAPRKQVGTM